jgi:hypothetical protein
MIVFAAALGPQQTIPDKATAIWKENKDRRSDMAPPLPSTSCFRVRLSLSFVSIR